MERGPSEPSDSELVERARRGDRDAFAQLYRRHQAAVYRFAWTMSGSSPVAEDVVQDVFLVLMRELDRYDSSRAALRTYLFGVARNVARHKARGFRRLLSLDFAQEVTAPDDQAAAMASTEETCHLRQCLKALPSTYREVIALCDLQELNYADAAVVLGVPVGTVRSRLHRGRQLLLERLRRRRGEGLPADRRCLI